MARFLCNCSRTSRNLLQKIDDPFLLGGSKSRSPRKSHSFASVYLVRKLEPKSVSKHEAGKHEAGNHKAPAEDRWLFSQSIVPCEPGLGEGTCNCILFILLRDCSNWTRQ